MTRFGAPEPLAHRFRVAGDVPRRSPLRTGVIALAASVLLSACGDTFRPPAAVVDGREISQSTLQSELADLLADPAYAQQVRGPQGEDRKKELTRQLLAFLIRQQLIDRFASANRVTASDADVQRELERFVEQSGGEEAFERELARRKLTFDEARQIIRRALVTSKVEELVTERRFGNSPELRREYEERIGEFTRVRLAHIVVPTRANALRVEGELNAAGGASGSNFGRLARRYSTDRRTAGSGGDLGWQVVAQLPPPLARTVASLNEGEVGGPVKTQAGWELVLLQDEQVASFEQARRQLLESRRQQTFDAWLADQYRRSDIEVNPLFGRFDQNTAQIQPITSTASL